MLILGYFFCKSNRKSNPKGYGFARLKPSAWVSNIYFFIEEKNVKCFGIKWLGF